MDVPRASIETVKEFLALHRIAIVGVSRQEGSFSVALFEEFRRRGYDVVPVNPYLSELFGKKCFARVQDIQPPVEGAILMTSPEVTDDVVGDCEQAGIRRVWLYRAGGHGAVSEYAVDFCKIHDMTVVPGECPFMFLPAAAGVHRLHGLIRKITGRFPRKAEAAAA
ncbi:MAG TPA: CoA-binding protein [Verrucomicrobiae bacterium]|nr:CoA-binding protein [Verrucomicrobiae bacterium]